MKKDALDILLFHQFGNYVMQRMLKVGKSSETRVYHMVVIMGVESRFVSSCASTSRRLPVYTTTTDGDGSQDSRSASIAAPADWPSMHLVVVDRGIKPSGRSFWRIVEGWIGREADVLIECCILFLAA